MRLDQQKLHAPSRREPVRRSLALVVLGVLATAAPASLLRRLPTSPVPQPSPPPAKHAPELLVPLIVPASLEVARRTGDGGVDLVARTAAYTASMTGEGVTLVPGLAGRARESRPATLRLLGARQLLWNPGAATGSVTHLLSGDDGGGVARREAPHVASARATDVYPGISIEMTPSRGHLAYAFHVAPGADPDHIVFRMEGASLPRLAPDGSLLCPVVGGEFRHHPPVAYQPAVDGQLPVSVAFAVENGGAVRFILGPRDPALPLVIDPEIEYSTYLSDDALDTTVPGSQLDVDSAGNLFLTLTTVAGKPPGQFGYDPAQITVLKLTGDGSRILYTTVVGGNGHDYGVGLCADSAGHAYVTGYTASTNFPKKNALTLPAITPTGIQQAFLFKLLPDGSDFVYSTTYGGNGGDTSQSQPPCGGPCGFEGGNAVAVSSDGAAVVVGTSNSTDLPLMEPVRDTPAGGLDAFVMCLTPEGGSLRFATYLGGSGDDGGRAVSVGPDGSIHVAGVTASTDFPVTDPISGGDTLKGTSDGFLATLSADGTVLVRSSYFGGTGVDAIADLAVDVDGSVVACGTTDSTDLPATQDTVGPEALGGGDGFVARLAANGGSIAWLTYLGGSDADTAMVCAVAADGTVHVAGDTFSSDLAPVESGQWAHGGVLDAYLVRLSASGEALLHSTYLGGADFESVRGVVLGLHGRVVLAGTTQSTDFPTVFALQGDAAQMDHFVTSFISDGDAPFELQAQGVAGTAVALGWSAPGKGEIGFVVERRVETGEFALLVAVPPESTATVDDAVIPLTTYTYRVRALYGDGPSRASNQAVVLLEPVSVPGAPSSLTVEPEGLDGLRLIWTDVSTDETGFSVRRRPRGGTYETVQTVDAGETTWLDVTVLPDRDYEYVVRALGSSGTSGDSPAATGRAPATLLVALARGTVVVAKKATGDRIKLSGSLALHPDLEAEGVPDVVTKGIEWRACDRDGTVVLQIPPGDAGWKIRGRDMEWRSPRGERPRLRFRYREATGAFRFSAGGAVLPIKQGTSTRLAVEVGADAGSSEEVWTLRGPRAKYRDP